MQDVDCYEGLYYINREDLSINSYDKLKWNGKIDYVLKGRKLKTDIKIKANHKLERIQLYKDGERKCYYLGRLLACHHYSKSLGIDPIELYHTKRYIKYIDGNSLNISMENIRFIKNLD